MKNEYKINYIAKLFNVKPSAIRYWETEGLIGSERADNNYRMFSKNDIFDIWEIDMYRKMEIPVKQLKKLPDMNINEIMELTDGAEKRIISEIQEKEKMLKTLRTYKNGFAEMQRINSRPFEKSIPDIEKIEVDYFNEESMKRTVENPYICCLVFNENEGFKPNMGLPYIGGELLWERNTDEFDYLECVIKTEVGVHENNNTADVIKTAENNGYKVNRIIARYLFSANSDGIRYDFHRAWLEVNKK